jgi:hypothetical protein
LSVQIRVEVKGDCLAHVVLPWKELNQSVFHQLIDNKLFTYCAIQATNLPQFFDIGDEHSHQSSPGVCDKTTIEAEDFERYHLAMDQDLWRLS